MKEPEIKCNFSNCVAGAGAAGNLQCFLNGSYSDPDCDKFQPEPDEYYEMKKDITLMIEQMGKMKDQIEQLTKSRDTWFKNYHNNEIIYRSVIENLEQENKRLKEALTRIMVKSVNCDIYDLKGIAEEALSHCEGEEG